MQYVSIKTKAGEMKNVPQNCIHSKTNKILNEEEARKESK